jgi:hypothetical protein
VRRAKSPKTEKVDFSFNVLGLKTGMNPAKAGFIQELRLDA